MACDHSRLGDLADLPEALRSQLKPIKAKRLNAFHALVLAVIADCFGGKANIDEILVGVWRLTETVVDRKKIARALCQLKKLGMLTPAPARSGIYKLTKRAGK